MIGIHAISSIQSELRSEVETSPSLLTLYNRVLALVADIPDDEARAIKKHSQTAALRAQLADAMGPLRVPFLDLQGRRALCSVVAQCEDEIETNHLCFALIEHIGGEVEMYIQAVDVDPDQQLCKGLAMAPEPRVHRQRVQPRLVMVDHSSTADVVPFPSRVELPGS